MGAPAASRLRVAALLALRPALRPVRFDAHVLGPGCAAFGLAGSALRPTPRRFRAAGPAPAPVTSPCRRMPGCNRGSARRRPNAPPGRVLARRASAATAIPFALLRVCQDRLCTYKVTWAAPPSGAGRAIALAIARVPHAIQSHAGTLRRLGSTYRLGGTPMDANTINATCNVLLVVIGIIGLVLVRKE